MRILKSVILIAATVTAFLSCQKELKYDDSGVSTGTFKKDAAGDCLPVTVTGIFKVDSTLSSAYFVDVQVNVSFPGTFDIRTDTVNGYWFNKAGSVVLGTNTIRLYASGKPIAAGTNTFTVKYGTGAGGSTCSFDITVVGPAAPAAVFTLSGAGAACANAAPAGVYTMNTALTAANTLTIEVNVTTPGTYAIAATTNFNGFSFSGSGVFTTAGLQNVTLTGTGVPTASGAIPVTVTDGVASCTFDLTVLPAGTGAAVFNFDGGTGACTNFKVNGTYTIGTAMTAANTVELSVTVATPGTYSIITNSLNGITFSKAGSFASAGTFTVILDAIGTISAATTPGAGTFTPVGGTCTFTVNFVAAPPLPNTDYFPLTNNSWWSYTDSESPAPGDTLYNVIYGTKAYNGNTYTEMQDNYATVPYDTAHYRKATNDYWQWMPTDYYSYTVWFETAPVYTDFNFLRENATAGATWTMPATGSYSGTVDIGTIVPATLKYDVKVTGTNETVTIGAVTYTNVIHMTVTPKFTVPAIPVTDLATEVDEYYYAKGIGLIKTVVVPDVQFGLPTLTYNIKNYKVF